LNTTDSHKKPARKKFSALLILLFAVFMAGCGGGSSPAVPAGAPDVLPPAAVSQFAATQGDGSITLTWSNPADADFQAVRVMRATDTVPVSAADGELLYTGADHAYLDTGLRHGQAYYYAAFAQDASGNFAAAATASATCAYKPFTFVAIPDTQYYSLDYPALFKTMTQWIVDYRREWNIRMVLHEGDITHKNTDSEWANAVAAITVMNNEVPYVLSIGNHDIPSSGDTAHFNEYFPYSAMKDLPGFGGVYESGKMDNSYYTFSAGGADWLVLSLIYNPGDAILTWAGSVARQHPSHRIIILTHAFLAPDDTRSSIGNNIWDKFAAKYENVTFVFNGHYTGGLGARLVSTGDNGNKVYQMFANYQTEWFGGKGQIRLVTMDPDARTVSVKTWSTMGKFYVTDDRNEFTFEDVDFGPLD
jgi:hypothetical protein